MDTHKSEDKDVRGLKRPILNYLHSNRSCREEFIVVCSSCKRIKDSKGYWKNLDGLWKIADMLLSHGLCPECAKNYSAEIMELVRAST